jgi:hypothetical protein
MERQLSLKGICSVDEWKEIREKIHYDFLKDNNFSELKESELLMSRMQTMQLIDPYIGTYFSKAWVKKHVLHLSEEDQQLIDSQLKEDEINEPSLQQPIPTVAANKANNESESIDSLFMNQINK